MQFGSVGFLAHTLRYCVASFALGVVMALALPPIGPWWLTLIAMSGLLSLAQAAVTRWRMFALGLSFGTGYFMFAFHWIGYAFTVDAQTYLWMMPFAVGGLALFMGSYWGVGFLVAQQMQRWRVPLFLGLPFGVALAEWVRGYLFTGFPWAAPGLIADDMGGVLQLASLIGMPGLTFIVLLWGAVPFALLHHWKSEGFAFRALLVVIAVALPLSWIWGNDRLVKTPTQFVDGVNIRLVQPNISQDDKWRDENALKIFNTLIAMSGEAAALRPTHIIWPESAVSFLLDESPQGLQRIGTMLGKDRFLITGAIRRDRSQEEKYFTSVLIIDGQNQVTGRYDKWRLVPGGEYLPLAWALEPLGFRKVVSLPESFTAGSGPQSLAVGDAGFAGPLICYEAVFPHDLVDANKRPNWLVNVTNDGWFGLSVGPHQHLAQVRMRAVEQGLPIARAANTGISSMIDPVGRYLEISRLGETALIDSKLPQALTPTVFAKWGVWPGFLMIGFLIAMSGLCVGDRSMKR